MKNSTQRLSMYGVQDKALRFGSSVGVKRGVKPCPPRSRLAECIPPPAYSRAGSRSVTAAYYQAR